MHRIQDSDGSFIPRGTEKTVRITKYIRKKCYCVDTTNETLTFKLNDKECSRPAIGQELRVKVGKHLAKDFYLCYRVSQKKLAKNNILSSLTQQIQTEFRLRSSFSFPVRDEAEALIPADGAERKDLRSREFVTIDGADAKDFDDAIHVQKLRKNWRLSVAIADVTHYVHFSRKVSEHQLDREALERGNSFYFPRSVLPMLPAHLSNDLCSLKPNEDRPVIVCELILSPDGTVLKSLFCMAMIRSRARLTYDEVNAVFFAKNEKAKDVFLQKEEGEQLHAMLTQAAELSCLCREKRALRGSLLFPDQEPRYDFDEEGLVHNIAYNTATPANALIEEFMILANEACARFLERKHVPFLYRVHEAPDSFALRPLDNVLSHCMPDLLPDAVRTKKRSLESEDLPALVSRITADKRFFLCANLVLRAMPKALYSTQNLGHFGLGSKAYCHFTSPIRRYADIIAHRALKYCLGSYKGPLPTGPKLQRIATHLNNQEKTAQLCERQMQKYLQCLFMRDQQGKRFSVIIISITRFGIFVRLCNKPVEGFLPLESITRKSDIIDTDRQEIRTRSGETLYCFGDVIFVRLLSVDMRRGHITFTHN